MKVIYKTSMVDRIDEKILEAKMLDKEIDRIILSPKEWGNLYKELQRYAHTATHFLEEPYSLGGAVAKFGGIPIFVE